MQVGVGHVEEEGAPGGGGGGDEGGGEGGVTAMQGAVVDRLFDDGVVHVERHRRAPRVATRDRALRPVSTALSP